MHLFVHVALKQSHAAALVQTAASEKSLILAVPVCRLGLSTSSGDIRQEPERSSATGRTR